MSKTGADLYLGLVISHFNFYHAQLKKGLDLSFVIVQFQYLMQVHGELQWDSDALEKSLAIFLVLAVVTALVPFSLVDRFLVGGHEEPGLLRDGPFKYDLVSSFIILILRKEVDSH